MKCDLCTVSLVFLLSTSVQMSQLDDFSMNEGNDCVAELSVTDYIKICKPGQLAYKANVS